MTQQSHYWIYILRKQTGMVSLALSLFFFWLSSFGLKAAHSYHWMGSLKLQQKTYSFSSLKYQKTEVAVTTVSEKWGGEDFQKTERATGGSPDSVPKLHSSLWLITKPCTHGTGWLMLKQLNELMPKRQNFSLSQTKNCLLKEKILMLFEGI